MEAFRYIYKMDNKKYWRTGLVPIPGASTENYEVIHSMVCFTSERSAWIYRERWANKGMHDFSRLPFEQELDYIIGASKNSGMRSTLLKDEMEMTVMVWENEQI